MSQNAHKLLLFFDNVDHFRNCLAMFKQLEAGNAEKAAEFSALLGVDILNAWNEDWFNHSVTPNRQFIRLDYDSSARYDLPLDVLKQLFGAGLRVACLEVFYDQVGEMAQFYFKDGKLLDKDLVYGKSEKIKAIVREHFEGDPEELEDDGYPRPCTIDKLIKGEARQQEEASEMMNTMLELAKAAKETGKNPVELVKSVLILRAVGKGLLHALIFGVITILLFKGLWLWIILMILLAVILPLIYVQKASAQFDDEDNDNEEAEEVIC